MNRFAIKGVSESTITDYINERRRQEAEGKLTGLIMDFPKDFEFAEGKEQESLDKAVKELKKRYGDMLCPWVWKKLRANGKLSAWGFDVLKKEESRDIKITHAKSLPRTDSFDFTSVNLKVEEADLKEKENE